MLRESTVSYFCEGEPSPSRSPVRQHAGHKVASMHHGLNNTQIFTIIIIFPTFCTGDRSTIGEHDLIVYRCSLLYGQHIDMTAHTLIVTCWEL